MPSDNAESRNALLQSLKFPFMNARCFSITQAHPGTCDWLFETSEFQTWRDQAESADGTRALWIKGEPGSGKSTMMKHTLEYCQKEFTNHSVLSHFFEPRGASLEKTTLGMLQSLVSQLLRLNDRLLDVFFEFFRGKLRVQDQSDWQWVRIELEKFLRLAIQQPPAKPLIILIDAIDECEELEVQNTFSFLEGLLQISNEKGVVLKLCISSRSWRSMEVKQETMSLALPDRQEHLEDIATYIQAKLLSSSHNIETTILNGCKGNFLWVVLVVAMLNRSHAEGQDESVRKRLEDESTSVNDVLHVVLKPGDGLEEQTSTERTLLLQLVLLSKRPLRLEEACAAIGRPPADNEASERYITNLSKGLVEVKEHQDGILFVQFIHNMVNEYLLSDKRLQVLSPELGDDPVGASHGRLWACCLTLVQTLIKPSMTEQKMRALDISHPFLSYAANCTLYHAEMAWESMTYQEQIQVWLKKQRPWFTRMKKYRNIEQHLGLLRVVILDGLPNLTRVLLVQNVDSMAYDEKRDTLQALAFSGGSTDMLKILLDHGAEINDEDGEYGDALQAGLRGGDEKVVRFLLKNGAYDERHFLLRGSPFETALRMGNLEILDILLKFGTRPVSISGEDYVTVLQAAAAVDGDNEEAVSLLVNRGADVNALGGFFGSALPVAVLEENKKIAQLLIDEGADINASGGSRGSALQAAAMCGNVEITKLLIDQGADINSEGGYYGGALQIAAKYGYVEILKLLIDQGANIEADGGDFGNALYAASSRGQLETVEFLLERGANPNAKVGYYGNPLQAAATSPISNLDVVKLLIARGSDINSQGGEYGNVLCSALAGHNFEIMIHLLKIGAKTDLRDSFNRTALHYAVRESSVEVVQELLNRGALPEEVDDAGASPLDVAVQKQHSDMIHPLLRHASSMPTLSANDWRDCLGWASSSYLEFRTSEPLCIKQHDRELFRYYLRGYQLWHLILSDDVSPIRMTDTLITSMSTAKVYILPNGEFLHHINASKFHCRWWRKGSHTGRDWYHSYFQTVRTWSVHSTTFPRDDIFRRLKADEHFIEIGFRANCFKVTEETWPNLQNRKQIQGDEAMCDEGLLCVMAPIPIEPSQGVDKHERTEDWRPVYLLSTMDSSPIALPQNGEHLLRPLISKFHLIVDKNCVVASSQLTKSRSQVLDKSGGDPKLLAQLLHNAQMLERMAENHKVLVQKLEMFWTSLSSVHHKQWKVGTKLSASHSTELGSQFEAFVQLDRQIRELDEKSQGIIQLEFNLTSILEAQRSTSANKSMKRLSWITFVFLPLVFIASLFGMNVDVLSDNPSWWWYFPLSGACMLSTLAVWLCFKRFSTLEGRLERRFWWLTGGDKQADVEQGLARPEKRREQTAKFSVWGKKRS